MYCPNCGSELKESDKFCPSCGTKIQSEKEEAYSMADVDNVIAKKSGFGDDPFAANDLSDVVPASKTEASDAENVKSEEKKSDTKNKDVQNQESKKSRFSSEGITGFILSLASLYGALIGLGMAVLNYKIDSTLTRALTIFILILNLGAEIIALCLCNIGAKKAEYRVFCFIGRGISIFGIVCIAIIILSFSSIAGLGKLIDLSELGRIL